MKQLEGFNIENTYGSLGQFVASRWFRSLIDRHNDEADEFHFDLFKPFVIGRDLNAKRDIVHINITSLWFLANTLRAIGTGWVFQLNSDATFNFCRTAVDMIGFGVNSLGNHNHPLCWSIKGTAGPKRMRILAELSQEKKKSQSKIPFLEMEGSGSKSIPTVVPEVENAVVPEVEMPTSSDDDFTEVLCKL